MIKLLIKLIINYEKACNNLSTSDNKNKNNIINNDIIEENNSLNEIDLNYSKINNDESLYDINDDENENINNEKDLKKLFLIGRATGILFWLCAYIQCVFINLYWY